MQIKFSFLVIIILGVLITACSSNHIKQENKQPEKQSTTKINKQKISINRRKVNEQIKQKQKVSIVKKQPQRKVNKKRNTSKMVKKISNRRFALPRHYKRRNITYNKKYPRRKYQPHRRYIVKKKPHYRRNYKNYKKHIVRRTVPHYPPRKHYTQNVSFAKALSNAAMARTRHRVRYDGKYMKIGYPWGDVPSNIGVCTDVVIRSYRRLGIDLQKAVHEDMVNGGFYDYPNIKKWGLSAPDKNIDHRRVYNLQAFFRRHGAQLPVTHNPIDYKPGDLVTWMVGPDLPHIGIVVEQRSPTDPRRHMIVHNIANGPEMEDVLFRYRITGHYRYTKNNRLIAPRRYKTNYASNNNIKIDDYQRLMRELSRKPVKSKRRARRNNPPLNIARYQSHGGISDADIRAVLGR